MKIGDKVQVFVADGFTAITPTKLEPYYYTWLRGDKLIVPSPDGWIDGIVINLDLDDPNMLAYEVSYTLESNNDTNWFPSEYIRKKEEMP